MIWWKLFLNTSTRFVALKSTLLFCVGTTRADTDVQGQDLYPIWKLRSNKNISHLELGATLQRVHLGWHWPVSPWLHCEVFFWEGTRIFSQPGRQAELAIQNRALNFFPLFWLLFSLFSPRRLVMAKKLEQFVFCISCKKGVFERASCPWCSERKSTKSYCFFCRDFLASRNRTAHAKVCQSENPKPLPKTEQMERILTDLVNKFNLGTIIGKCVPEGVVLKNDDKTVYLEWTIIEKSVSLQISEGNPLVSGDWITSSMRSKKRKKIEVDNLDGEYWNVISRKEPSEREPQKEANIDIQGLSQAKEVWFFFFEKCMTLTNTQAQALELKLQETEQEKEEFRKSVQNFCSNLVSEAKSYHERHWLIKRISEDLPDLCNSVHLQVSPKVIRAAKTPKKIEPSRKEKKLAKYKNVLLDYFNEILPVKSGQKYRLQYLTDKELFFRIRWFLIENHGVLVHPATIRKFVKKETRRSHVTKLDSCPYCHKLRFDKQSLTDEKRIEYLDHKRLAKEQQDFKRLILQAVADGSIPNGVVVMMDFSKFDTSRKCESIECHIIVLRYGKSLAEKVEHITGVSKMINNLHWAYVNIFAEKNSDKHDPDFVVLSWLKVVDKFEALFRECEHLFVFTDGGPHHYKSRHGILGFAYISHLLQSIMRPRRTQSFPQISFHFHAAHHGSDICDCIAAIDKREIRKYTLKCGKYIYKGEDLVTALEPLGGNFFSDWIVKGPDPIIRAKNEISKIRSFHCFEFNFSKLQQEIGMNFHDLIKMDGEYTISAWAKSFDNWDISKTQTGRWRKLKCKRSSPKYYQEFSLQEALLVFFSL